MTAVAPTGDTGGSPARRAAALSGGPATARRGEPTTPRGGEPTTARLPSLTGLRFVGAFLVFGFHVHVEGFTSEGPVHTVMQWIFGAGAGGVSFFFVLSGFVLTWSVRPGHTTTRFWRRRIAKIYPNHAVTAIAALAVVTIAGAGLSAAVVVPNLLLLHAWSPDPAVFFGLNTVSWSLACEVLFYALFPLLYRGISRIPGPALWPALLGAFALTWLVPVAAHLLPEENRYWAIWVFPVARVPEFVAGMLLARIVLIGRWPSVKVWPVATLTVLAYVCSRWMPEDFRLVAATAAPLALLVAAFAAVDVSGRRTIWSSGWAIWLGELSYAFYLVHLLALRLLIKVFGVDHPAPVGIALAVAALALAVGSSLLLYRCVELPGMRLIGGYRRPAALVR